MLLSAIVFSAVKKKVRAGDREGALSLARRWRRLAPRSALAVYTEYWALTGDREYQPGEHIELLRRCYALAPVSTGSAHLVHQLIRMYAKWGREQYAAEAERILERITTICRESPWTVACHAELAFLRGDYDKERELRSRIWQIHPRPDLPNALLDRGIQYVDEGDRDAARELLFRASAAKGADALVHIYLSAFLEEEDPAGAARARAAARDLWLDSDEGFERKFDFVRQRLTEGKFADVRPRG